MDKKLVADVLNTAGKLRGTHRLFDPLVESGYDRSEVEEAVSFCIENRLLDTNLYRPKNIVLNLPMRTNGGQWA